MEFKTLINELRNGNALPLGFESAYQMNAEFVNTMLNAGPSGLECVLLPTSSFNVSETLVKDSNSPAFAKRVCNISCKVRCGTVESVVNISVGTLATIAENGGKAILCVVQPNAKDGTKLTTKAGVPIYNVNAVSPVPFTPERIDTLATFVASMQEQSEDIGAPNVQGANKTK